MEPHSEILHELQLLNSPLAHAPRALGLSVPAGYFDTSASLFVAGVLAQDAPDVSLSVAHVQVPAGELPKDYFETSASLFVAGVLAQEGEDIALPVSRESISAAPLPEGYFETAAQNFVAGVLAQGAEDPALDLPKAPAGNVPNGYFQNFPTEVLALALALDFVEALPRPATAAVPAGYFEGLPAQVLRRVTAGEHIATLPKPAKRQTIALPLFRWAAAAALIVGVGLGLHRAGEPQAGPQAVSRALAAVPQQELQAYVTQNLDEFETELLEKDAALSQMPLEAPRLPQEDIELYLQEEGLL